MRGKIDGGVANPIFSTSWTMVEALLIIIQRYDGSSKGASYALLALNDKSEEVSLKRITIPLVEAQLHCL